MRRRTPVLLFAVALVAITAVAVPGAATLSEGEPNAASASGLDNTVASDHIAECAAEPPDDFSEPDGGTSDTIGYVDGYWYNEPLDVDDELENPLSDEELEELVPRTAARVEALRCLTFEDVPPLDFTTTDQYQEELEESFEQTDEEFRQFRNAQLATQFVLGQEEDALDLEAEARAEGALAFYDPTENYMALIVEDPDEFTVDQVTVAHELVHALQDQHFDLNAVRTAETDDGNTAETAVIEGGATHVDSMYEENCESDIWVDSCVRDMPDGDADEEPPNWALAVDQFAPYVTPLVAEVQQEEGWETVNEMYEEMPDSTVEAIYPDRYNEFERTDISVPEESTGEWERIAVEGQEKQKIGQHGLVSMLAAPIYETQGMVELIDINQFLQPTAGGDLNFDVEPAAGWTNDNLYAYRSDDGQLGSTWKLAWESEQDAEQFADAYAELAEYRGATQSDEYANVYTADTGQWDMSVAVEQTDDRVWIVTAPTVDDLTDIHDIDLVEAEDDPTPDEGTPTPTPADDGDNGVTDADDNGVTDADDTAADADDDGAGFGIVAGAVAVVLSTLLVRHRQNQ